MCTLDDSLKSLHVDITMVIMMHIKIMFRFHYAAIGPGIEGDQVLKGNYCTSIRQWVNTLSKLLLLPGVKRNIHTVQQVQNSHAIKSATVLDIFGAKRRMGYASRLIID